MCQRFADGPARSSAGAAAKGESLLQECSPPVVQLHANGGHATRTSCLPAMHTLLTGVACNSAIHHALPTQASEMVWVRLVNLVRLFDLAGEGQQERLAVALPGSSLPCAALAAVEALQRVKHSLAGERVRQWPNG